MRNEVDSSPVRQAISEMFPDRRVRSIHSRGNYPPRTFYVWFEADYSPFPRVSSYRDEDGKAVWSEFVTVKPYKKKTGLPG